MSQSTEFERYAAAALTGLLSANRPNTSDRAVVVAEARAIAAEMVKQNKPRLRSPTDAEIAGGIAPNAEIKED